MLKVFHSMDEMRFEMLSQLYGHDTQQETDFYEYLCEVFFRTKGAVYCVWLENGRYCSALRLEPYEDGLVLAGLVTAQELRRRGYAALLIGGALNWLAEQGRVRVYSHIHHNNRGSIAVHERCGFRRIADYAVFLDGSVSALAGTYYFDTGSLD